MSDFERRMRESLRSVGESYRPSDPHAAKQEFFRRRRRRRVWMWAGGAVAAGATAAIAFVAFAILDPSADGRRQTRTVTPAVSAHGVDLTRIGVGNGPDGVAVGAGYVWVVNGESKTLLRIDPADDSVETIEGSVGEQPEDVLVAHGSVWVTDRGTGDVYRYDAATETMEKATTIGSGEDLDIAAGEANDVWIAHVGGDLYRLSATSGDQLGSWPVAENLADVSFIDSEVWVYDEATGEIVRFDPTSLQRTARAYVGESDSADLVAGLRYVWFYRGSDGKLLQVDRQTARVVKRFQLGGTFGSLTIGEESLWAMVTEGGAGSSGDGRLYRIDVDDALEIQQPVPVSDTPYDIAAGYGSVWATNYTADQVTRVELEPGAAPQPTVAETPTGEAVFYYSDGEDILAFGDDSNVARITETDATETSPAMSAASNALAFQRNIRDARPEIIGLDLNSGRELFVATGSVPAIGPDGRVAYALTGSSESNPTTVVVNPFSELEPTEVAIPGQPGPPTVDRIAWDPGGDVLYVETDRGREIVAIDLMSGDPQPARIAPDMDEGSVLVAPSSREPGVLTAIRLCCAGPPDFNFTTAELVEIAFDPISGGVRPAEKVLGIDDLLSPSLTLFAVPAGHLDYENDRGWSVNDHRAWLVGDGEQLYLMDESGEKDLIPVSGVKGLTVAPQFAD